MPPMMIGVFLYVRPLSHHAAGREGIGLAVLFRDGVVVDHRVHVAAGDEKAEPRLAEGGDGGRVLPVRLGEDADLIARVLQHARNDGVAEGGVIDIRIADHIYKIALRPPARVHIPSADGQKIRHPERLLRQNYVCSRYYSRQAEKKKVRRARFGRLTVVLYWNWKKYRTHGSSERSDHRQTDKERSLC